MTRTRSQTYRLTWAIAVAGRARDAVAHAHSARWAGRVGTGEPSQAGEFPTLLAFRYQRARLDHRRAAIRSVPIHHLGLHDRSLCLAETK